MHTLYLDASYLILRWPKDDVQVTHRITYCRSLASCSHNTQIQVLVSKFNLPTWIKHNSVFSNLKSQRLGFRMWSVSHGVDCAPEKYSWSPL